MLNTEKIAGDRSPRPPGAAAHGQNVCSSEGLAEGEKSYLSAQPGSMAALRAVSDVCAVTRIEPTDLAPPRRARCATMVPSGHVLRHRIPPTAAQLRPRGQWRRQRTQPFVWEQSLMTRYVVARSLKSA